jgi:choline dehydrogenase-like flavoprotein
MQGQNHAAETDCVVGSGPSGVACAAALLRRGRRVLMLDAGVQLEPDRAAIVRQMAEQAPSEWSPENLARIKEGMNPDTKGIPQKLLFGSDYPYRDAGRELGLHSGGVGLQPSLAWGGLSTVWGSALMAYHDHDISDWPIQIGQLAPHYRGVLDFVNVSAGHDALEELFPLYTETPGQLEMSRQATAVWQKLERHAVTLKQRGIHFGRARLAIQARQSETGLGCVHCGGCMYGCPYGYIFNSANLVSAWINRPLFQYQRDVIVESLQEQGGHVWIRGHRRGGREPFEMKVGRVFLAAGVIPSTGILLRSLKLWDVPAAIKDSQYFLLPAVLTKRVADVRNEALHALSQIFLEVLDPAVSRQIVHLQLYTYNELMGRAVRNLLGPLSRPLELLAREMENRLILFQGFIHSTESSRIEVLLTRRNSVEQLELKPNVNPQARMVVRRVARKLFGNALRLGAVPLLPMLQFATPGRSFHSGGSFPMARNPGRMETDVLGRPAGWHRVHVVDATVFPSIAATTITYTAMANAHRIATEAPET